jgi:hypothetical protein
MSEQYTDDTDQEKAEEQVKTGPHSTVNGVLRR